MSFPHTSPQQKAFSPFRNIWVPRALDQALHYINAEILNSGIWSWVNIQRRTSPSHIQLIRPRQYERGPLWFAAEFFLRRNMLTTRFLLALAILYLARQNDLFQRRGLFFFPTEEVTFLKTEYVKMFTLCDAAPGLHPCRGSWMRSSNKEGVTARPLKGGLERQTSRESSGNSFACSDQRVCVRITAGID